MFQLNFGLFENVSKSGAFDWLMRRNDYFQGFISDIFLEPDMTSFLPNYHPSVAAQGIDDFPARKAWYFGHKFNSLILALSLG